MEKQVILSIRGQQTFENMEPEVTELVTEGTLHMDEGSNVTLTYQESELTGLEGTRTSVMVMPDQVVVDRDGMLTGRMVFREGARDSYPYQTPYGQMMLGIDTRSIRPNFNENGGDVEIDYITDLAHTVVARNKFRISVKEMEKANG